MSGKGNLLNVSSVLTRCKPLGGSLTERFTGGLLLPI